jgi:SET domain-containing protein
MTGVISKTSSSYSNKNSTLVSPKIFRAKDRTEFSPVHLNHADKGTRGCNVIRLLEDDRVAFFTSRDIVREEELCFDYGSNFWKGCERLKL